MMTAPNSCTMDEVKIAVSPQAHKKTLSSTPDPPNPSDHQGKQTYKAGTEERRNEILEDGISGVNEKHRPVVDIQEYFVRF
jgi:hypothetical protein